MGEKIAPRDRSESHKLLAYVIFCYYEFGVPFCGIYDLRPTLLLGHDCSISPLSIYNLVSLDFVVTFSSFVSMSSLVQRHLL